MTLPVPSLNGATADGVPQGVSAALDHDVWPSGNGESPSHETSDWPASDWPSPD
jgi:hypothetical protein